MERLQKLIAQAGITSRRKAEKLIEEGRVYVNGNQVKEVGAKADLQTDEISVDGVPLQKEEPVYYLLYKPSGVISSAGDDKGRKTVIDLVPGEFRVFPVGRLDFDTSGLIVLTNDGEFANLLMHPKYRIHKTYIAKVKGLPLREDLKKLDRGIVLEDGKTAPAKTKVIKTDKRKGTAVVEITIHEGRNRQVRRMFDAIGFPVMKLKRERYGILDLKGLNAGDWRELKPHEVKTLREIAEK
ncbi:pseudouridine synthase [Salisediminibacterium selenitireducens]|uniref:Pseudouridine synthase n=1 Tax=Bacillus selenitireducens (strain ATCC 700615 / DSM 15326 / MLS10) TaxID=439292 RepID=D6XVE5_BACIE|nr:pseudouridine synthase [Salisediminibacterium selenitireducens]ADH99683.1 pseudouridine synthase [[Bacillus] selenitireducens MLS10]